MPHSIDDKEMAEYKQLKAQRANAEKKRAADKANNAGMTGQQNSDNKPKKHRAPRTGPDGLFIISPTHHLQKEAQRLRIALMEVMEHINFTVGPGLMANLIKDMHDETSRQTKYDEDHYQDPEHVDILVQMKAADKRLREYTEKRDKEAKEKLSVAGGNPTSGSALVTGGDGLDIGASIMPCGSEESDSDED